jgi:EAL domain-containing protein (putative c-di-GMP-specific phosphodiesterase class I)
LETVVRASAPELSIAVRIDNHDEVAAAYGLDAIGCMRATIRQCLGELDGVQCTLAANDTRHIRIDVRDLAPFHARQAFSLGDIAGLLLLSIASIRVPFDGETIFIAPSIVPVASPLNSAATDRRVAGDQHTMALPSAEWIREYREDMRRAAAIFGAIADDRVDLAWQPVRHAINPDDVLYHECLVRAVDAGGQPLAPGDFVPALERLGLVRAFDHHIIRRVIDELAAMPGGSLAVNISGLSAIDDGWWQDLKKALWGLSDLASRLVIEITETADLQSISATIAFVSEMRRLGCKIAIDDFGMGHNSLRRVIALKPDVVKIDAFYIGWAEKALDGQRGIAHMVNLLGALAPVVIAEGVATQEQSDLICAAGAVWQQGYHHGSPTIVRPSRYGATSEEGRTSWAVKASERDVGAARI